MTRWVDRTMRDLIAGVIAVLLLAVAASLATTLRLHRWRRQRTRDTERAMGRTIVAEIPAADDLVLFTEDTKRFYYGDRSIDKDLVSAVRLLVNGVPIAASVSRRLGGTAVVEPTSVAERGRGAAAERDRPSASSGRPEREVEGRRAGAPGAIEDQPEGIARDRWDVAIETVNGTTLVQCGAIRERVSQELARAVFDAVKRDLEARDRSI
jgi:hypothetical protein